MRNKLTKFLTSECPPKGMRQFAKTWKYAACMLLAFILGIGQMWAADETYEIANPTASVFGYSDGVVNVYGDVQTSKKINNKSQTVFVSSSDYPVIITSNCANIKGISFNVCCSSSGSGTDNSIKIQTQQGNTLADVPASTFIATKDGSSLTSLCPIAVTKDQTKQTSISITFNTKQSIVAIVRNSNQGWIKDLVVTYDDAVAPPSQFVVAKPTSTANIYTLTPSKGTMSGSTTTDKKTYNSTDFYKLNSTNAFTMPTANKFKVGDVVVFEIAPSQAKKSIGIKIGSTTLVVNKAQAVGIKLPYIITTESDELEFERNSSDTYLSSVTIYHTEVIPTGHHVTYDLNGGTGTTPMQADVAEGAKFTLHNGTTDITAPSGKKFDGWHDGTTKYAGGAEYTMGTADVELTAQWADVYTVTYVPNNGVLPAETMTDSNSPYVEDDEVTLLANAFTAPENKEFDAWVVTKTASGAPITVTAGKFTMPAEAVTVTATWKDACALDPTVSATTLGTTSYTTQVVNCAGISVLGSAGCTISEYGYVYGTSTAPTISDNKKALEGDYTVAGAAFAETTLSGLASNTTYYVRAFATNSHGTAYGDEISFTTLAPLGNVLVVASSASQTSDAITALRNNGFVVTVSAPNNSRDYTGYDLVVLDESLDGKNGVAGKEEGDIKGVNIPLLNLKSFFYNSGRWGWGTGNNGTADNEIAKIPATYKNAQSHPIFAGLTITDGNIDLIDPAKTGNTLQTATGLAAGKEGYVLATVGGNAFIHELTPAQRGVTDAKYLMVAISNNAKDNLSADGELLIVNAAKYLIGSTAWVPQYYTVSFDPHGGNPIAPRTGNPGITLPDAEYGTQSFLGWFTEETGGTKIGEAGDSYTPTADITLHAHWEAVSTDARLSAITFSSNAGTLAPAFDPEVVNYTYTMPYGTADVPTITGATKANANAQAPVIGTAAAAWGNAQTVKGVAQSGAEKTYTITMKLAPKDGVEIIGVVTTGGTNKTVSGLYKGDASVNLDSNKKIGGDKYIYVTLASGYTFEETDVLVVDVEAKSDLSGGNKALEITTGVGNIDGSVWKSIAFEDYTTGENIIPLTGIAANQTSIGLKRSSNQNAFINGLKVYRPMNPVLTAITINDRDGVIDPLDDKHFTVTIPNDANLASLTVEPTIVRNAPHATTPEQVMTNEGAWVLTEDGNNTYRIMDKDGDYTDYTITLIRDVLKYQVSFDTDGGSSIDPVEVVANGYLTAGQVPADPTKAENVFLGWAETAGGDVVADITAIQITDDKTFFAKWEAEPDGIKLFSNTGELNTAKFITPAKADDPIVIDEVPYPTLVAFGSNRTSLGGAKQADVVLYSATTNQTKIKFQLYNTNSSAKKAYLWMVEEGATESDDPIEIEVDGETMVTTGYYTFNSNKNRSFYLTSGSKADIKVLQAKVIESGTDIHQFGQAGYELNFNKGRIAVAASATVQFEGASIHSNEDYSVLNSSNFKPKTYIQFNNAVANTIVKITKSSSNKYYVTNDLDNKGEGYSTDAEVELTTTGTWYIGSVNSGSVAALSKIEFIAPKCAEPAFNSLANSDLCEGAAFEALNGTATVGDAGTPIYQWYKADGDVEIEGATSATYTPTADGSYYVVATNQLAGYSDNSKKSNTVSVTHFATAEITTAPLNQRGVKDAVVTLSVAATGKNLSYEWFTCDNEAGDNPVVVAPAATGTSLNITITEGMSQWYKVVVTSDCGNASATAKVEQFVPVVQANVSASTTWNWTEAASVNEIKLTDATTPKKNEGFVMANGAATVYNNANFESDKLYLEGEYIVREGKYFQGQMIKFNTTVAGLVRVKFSHTGSSKPARELYINGVGTGDTRTNATAEWSKYVEVPAGEVSITSYYVDPADGAGIQYIRVPQIEFLAENTARARALTVGNLGTTCIENACIVRGAEIYEIKGRNEIGKIVFDQLGADEVLEAGYPYVMVAKEANIRFFNTTAEPATEPYNAGNGLIGTFEQKEFAAGEASEGLYFFKDHALWAAKETGMTIPAYRCYLDMNAVGTFNGASPAPGRRRITMDVHGQNAATGIGNVQGDEVQSTKVLINGELFILRGEKMYDATGRMVK